MSRRLRSLDHIIWDQLFAVSPDSAMTLQAQLREQLVVAILDGYFLSNEPLPPCRKLAKHLNVARNTVVLAYQHLVDEGYLIPRRGSGYYINPDMLVGRVESDPRRSSRVERFNWNRRFGFQPSVQHNIVKPCAWKEYPYPFIYGQLDPDFVPVADWRECSRETLSVQAIQEWVTDRIEFDDPLLIEQLQARVLPRRGIRASAEEILITVGAQNGLYLVASLLMTNRTTVGIEDPGYVDARNIFALRTSHLVGLPVDEAGLVVDERLDNCDYVYVTPSHQCPTMATMSVQRRRHLLERSVAAGFAIIEDDYESESNFFNNPTPALKSLDRDGRVIYVGSISRSLAPGLRIGYLVGSPELIREARALRRLMLRHPPGNNQQAFAHFLARGHYDALLCRLSHTYQERWQAMRDALERYLPEAVIMPSSGGTACWVKGPAELDAGELQRKAMARGILIEPGDIYFLSDYPPRNYFRLGFSSIPVDRIEPGIHKLATLIHQMLVSRCSPRRREPGHDLV